MGLLQSYGSLLLKHPGKIILVGVTSVLLLFLATLWIRPVPNFSDPLVGFEVRGTPIAVKLNAYKLLSSETSASANNLSLQANSDIFEYVKYRRPASEHIHVGSSDSENETTTTTTTTADKDKDIEIPLILEMGNRNDSTTRPPPGSEMDDGEEEYYQSVNATRELTKAPLIHYSLDSPRAFCGKLNEGYSQVVIAPLPSRPNSAEGLFSLQSMRAICHLDRVLRLEQSSYNPQQAVDDKGVFQQDCERFKTNNNNSSTETLCCNSFTLPNYIACLSNKSSCMDLTQTDISAMQQAIVQCAPHYLRSPHEICFQNKSSSGDVIERGTSNQLGIFTSTDHLNAPDCGHIPEKCLRCNGWTYAVMHYLASDKWFVPSFTSPNAKSKSPSPKQRQRPKQPQLPLNKLRYTNIFLPMAKSSALMKYYQTISRQTLQNAHVRVEAMDLGLKNSLFELLISQDARLFILALISILTVISIYTWSFILSLVILTIICLSLCLSYSIYELLLNIPVFPFMNLLAVVISFGICSDNAMLFCKHWATTNHQDPAGSAATTSAKPVNGSTQQDRNPQYLTMERANVDRLLRRSILSTLVATLATACSFIISAISGVVAVRCFCIYATLSVLTNYLLIVILLPPALILDSRLANLVNEVLENKGPQLAQLVNSLRSIRQTLLDLGTTIHNVEILNLVTKFKFSLMAAFLTILICASVLVFHEPRMNLADEDSIQLLSSRHTFEQYDKNLKRQFAFNRPQQSNHRIGDQGLETLPIRVVFGVLPVDNGDHLDPHDRGTLVFDPEFDMSEPAAQIWLLEFCDNLRKQRFVHYSTNGLLVDSCFMYSFRNWMEERKCNDPVLGDDLRPCCREFTFPLQKQVFDQCLQVALRMFHNSPDYPEDNPGVYFHKNSTRVAAYVVEFKSNQQFSESYTRMERFYSDVDEWVRLQINNTAPPGLRSGWFISSNLELLALQDELASSTSYAILLEVLFAMLALLIGTKDLLLTLIGSLTIGTIILTTIAVLILLRWTLGVAESILISLTIGLSIEFALHYAVAYSERRRRKASIENIIHAILDEVGSPIGLATITTCLAGFVIVWSDILAYQELGVFLMLIALVSWLASTFFLLPMLATLSSMLECVQTSFGSVARATLSSLIHRMCSLM